MKLNVIIYNGERKPVFDEIYDDGDEIQTSNRLITIYAKNSQGLDMVINIPILEGMSFRARIIE